MRKRPNRNDDNNDDSKLPSFLKNRKMNISSIEATERRRGGQIRPQKKTSPKKIKINNDTYVGNLNKKNQPHGKGVRNFHSDKTTYKGNFFNGQRHGMGKLFYPDMKLKYSGNWEHDKRSGFGRYNFAQGGRYKGDWKNDMREGDGQSYYKASVGGGIKYDGNWHLNYIWGFGKYYRKNGRLMYEGNFVKGMRNGYGINFYSNGDIYKGGWKKDKKSGSGKMEYTSQIPQEKKLKKNIFTNKYEGMWVNDKRNGRGIMYCTYDRKIKLERMTKFEGFWKNGKKHGKGVFSIALQKKNTSKKKSKEVEILSDDNDNESNDDESDDENEGKKREKICVNDFDFVVIREGIWDNGVFNEDSAILNIQNITESELQKLFLQSQVSKPETIRNWKDKQAKSKYFEERYDKLKDSTTCCICLSEKKSICFFPCKHVCTCENCSEKISTCPMCRKDIQTKVKVYI